MIDPILLPGFLSQTHVRDVQPVVGAVRQERAAEDREAFERVADGAPEALGYPVSMESDTEPPDCPAAA
jgi:hypothetical protein